MLGPFIGKRSNMPESIVCEHGLKQSVSEKMSPDIVNHFFESEFCSSFQDIFFLERYKPEQMIINISRIIDDSIV